MRYCVAIFLLISGFSLTAHVAPLPAKQPASQGLSLFMAVSPGAAFNSHQFDNFIDKLGKKRKSFKTDTQFLDFVFTRVHREYLRNFREYTTLAELFDAGAYNCLTATILLSAILNHFEIDHEVVETNYHIFILARTEQGEVLMETTDAHGGFVTAPEEIENRIRHYKEHIVPSASDDLAYYRYHFNLYNTVSQNELVGLLFYNIAVEAFNRQDVKSAIAHLAQAGERYVSPRIEEFSELLLLAVHESRFDAEEKAILKKTLQTIRYKALLASAENP